MEFKARILHTTNLVSAVTISVPDLSGAKLTSGGVVTACTELRKVDPTVAAVKVAVPGFADYYWEGHAISEHLAVAAARERAGTDNW